MFWRKCDMLGTKQWYISPMHTHVFCTVSNTVTFVWASWAITITSNEHYVVSNHRSFDCLYNSLCAPTSNSHQSPNCWLFVRGIHRWPVNSPHKGPVTQKRFPFDDAIVTSIWTHPRKYIPPEFAWKPKDKYVYVQIERPRYFEL